MLSVEKVLSTHGVMMTVIAIEPGREPLSVTEAVIVCVPIERVEIENEPPLPIVPSRLEVQARLADRSPSSTSLAVPMNVTGVPDTKDELSAGEVMFTDGAVLGGVVFVGVGVGVSGVAVGVGVSGVAVGVGVSGVAVGVGVSGVAVGVAVGGGGVLVGGTGVLVGGGAVGAGVFVRVGVAVGAPVLVREAVAVMVAVFDGEGVFVMVAVCDAVEVIDGVEDGVRVMTSGTLSAAQSSNWFSSIGWASLGGPPSSDSVCSISPNDS